MKILVWKSYGNVEVNMAETVLQCRALAMEVVDVIEGWCCGEFDEEVAEFKELIAQELTPADLRRHTINLVRDLCDDTEDFEYFSFTDLIVK